MLNTSSAASTRMAAQRSLGLAAENLDRAAGAAGAGWVASGVASGEGFCPGRPERLEL